MGRPVPDLPAPSPICPARSVGSADRVIGQGYLRSIRPECAFDGNLGRIATFPRSMEFLPAGARDRRRFSVRIAPRPSEDVFEIGRKRRHGLNDDSRPRRLVALAVTTGLASGHIACLAWQLRIATVPFPVHGTGTPLHAQEVSFLPRSNPIMVKKRLIAALKTVVEGRQEPPHRPGHPMHQGVGCQTVTDRHFGKMR